MSAEMRRHAIGALVVIRRRLPELDATPKATVFSRRGSSQRPSAPSIFAE